MNVDAHVYDMCVMFLPHPTSLLFLWARIDYKVKNSSWRSFWGVNCCKCVFGSPEFVCCMSDHRMEIA